MPGLANLIPSICPDKRKGASIEPKGDDRLTDRQRDIELIRKTYDISENRLSSAFEAFPSRIRGVRGDT